MLEFTANLNRFKSPSKVQIVSEYIYVYVYVYKHYINNITLENLKYREIRK